MTEPIPSGAVHHDFRCPKCDALMLTYERSGVTVERCSECRGVFLDRGELERLVDMEAAGGPAPWAVDGPPLGGRPERQWDDGDDDDDDDDGWQRRDGRRARRGAFLEDLFDVFRG